MKALFLWIALLMGSESIFAQAPALPPTNLGLANLFDGVAGKPGFVYQGYVQLYETHHIYDASGDYTGSMLKVNSLVSLNQLIYLTPVRVLGGDLGFTVIVPIVKITATDRSQQAPSVNPAALGDVVQGTAVQWSDKKLFGKAFSHRAELDVTIPNGSYSPDYVVNASSHAWAIGAYHAFTLFLNKTITASSRNQFNYNFNIIGRPDKPGMSYNGNYSIDVAIAKEIRLEAAAYYLTQLTEDSYNGDHRYYQTVYHLSTTKVRVLGFGPGVGYFLPGGVLMEAKVFFETAARNTTQGVRPTLRIAIPFPGRTN